MKICLYIRNRNKILHELSHIYHVYFSCHSNMGGGGGGVFCSLAKLSFVLIK